MTTFLVPKVSRFKNMQIMRKVAMYGARFIRSEYPDIKVFRVSRWKFSPKRLIMPQSTAGETTEQQEEESGAWNLDGEILPQPPNQSLHFRFKQSFISLLIHFLCFKTASPADQLLWPGRGAGVGRPKLQPMLHLLPLRAQGFPADCAHPKLKTAAVVSSSHPHGPSTTL
jgi:hypothetical protein